jgi:dihydrofolate reductase
VGAEVRDLRERHRQIHTWGSANLLQTLFREALVDQMNLWVCPVVIGRANSYFLKAQPPPASSRLSRRSCIPEG